MKALQRSGVAIGSAALFLALLLSRLWIGVSPALAQELPPRPTVPPLSTPQPKSDDSHELTTTATGRITGTVIDQTTGAPIPGIPVAVGDVVVQSDQNGNYDRNGLPDGQYRVELMLASERGVVAQGPITVTLAANQTVVQHLFFQSMVAPSAPAAPPAAEPAVEPLAAPPPEVAPEHLPRTGDTSLLPQIRLEILIGVCVLLLGAVLGRTVRRRKRRHV